MFTAISTLWLATYVALFIASAIAIFKIVKVSDRASSKGKVSDRASSKGKNLSDHIFFVLMIYHIFFVLMIFGVMSIAWACPFMLLFFLVLAFERDSRSS